VLAWLSYKVVPHVVHPGDAPALSLFPTGYPLGNVVKDLTLIGGTSTSLGVL
jgi:hypothetical protein